MVHEPYRSHPRRRPERGNILTIEEVANVLREYGSAIRGDWGSIDGRSEQGTIDTFADACLKPNDYTAAQLRDLADICPHGSGHWTEWCTDSCEESA